MGYHIVWKTTKVPAVAKDGGTGSWREAKKTIRAWHLEQAASLRDVTEKSYFDTNEVSVPELIQAQENASA